MLKTTSNFALFDPFILGEGEQNLHTNCWSFTMTKPPEYIWRPSTAWLLSAVDW